MHFNKFLACQNFLSDQETNDVLLHWLKNLAANFFFFFDEFVKAGPLIRQVPGFT
jgi:hypothetical protein